MTNGSHTHTCSICHKPFECALLTHCYVEDKYAVCYKPDCVTAYEKPKQEEWDED